MRVLCALVFVACGSPDGSVDGPDDDPGADVVRLCPDYTGFGKVGDRSSMESMGFQADEPGYTLSTTQLLSIDAGELTVQIDAVYVQENVDDYTARVTAVYRCDVEGLWLRSNHYAYSYRQQGTGDLVEGWSDTVFDTYLAVPADVTAGWEVSTTYEATDHLDNVTPGSLQGSYVVGEERSITVPAGTFDVKEFLYSSGEHRSSSWRNKDAGVVRTDTEHLVSQ